MAQHQDIIQSANIMQEILETVDIFAESTAIRDNTPAEQANSTMELGEGDLLATNIPSNFTYARSGVVMFESVPKQALKHRTNSIVETTPTRPVNADRTSPSSTRGRNLFVISPVKNVSRKRCNEESIKTLIFWDLETTGLIRTSSTDPKKNYMLRKSRSPADFANELDKFIKHTQKENYPMITEMSFVSVPRETFEKYIKEFENLRDIPGSKEVRVPVNKMTRQINPKLSENEWQKYENLKSQNPLALAHEKKDLHLKNTFDTEWKQIRQFLDSCPKPACLIAHNGLYFDFRVLYGELDRYNLIESHSIPEGILFVDSLLAFQNIEDSIKQRMTQTLQGIDWNLITRLSLNEQEQQNTEDVSVDHPMNFLSKSQWPAALFTRFSPSDWKKTAAGQWEFVPMNKRYRLKDLYETAVHGSAYYHFAEDDALCLQQVCLAYGHDFLAYMDAAATEVPF